MRAAIVFGLVILASTAVKLNVQQSPQAFLPAPSAMVKESVPKFDRKMKALIITQAVISVVDMAQTYHCLHSIVGCQETNVLYGPHPSTGRLFGMDALIDFGWTAASYELRRHGPRALRRLWMAPSLYDTAWHVEGIATSVYGGPHATGGLAHGVR